MSNEITNTETTEIDTNLEELKLYATEIGVSFRENIGITKLEEKIEAREEEIAQEEREKKIEEKKNAKKIGKEKIKVIIEPRDRQDGITDQYFGYNSIKTGIKENIQIMFGEEVEISKNMFDHINNITYKVTKYKTVPNSEGRLVDEPYTKEYKRFMISKV